MSRHVAASFKHQFTWTKEAHRARLTRAYHSVEKGLALPHPRLGFGKERVLSLASLMDSYLSRYGVDETVQTCLSVLRSYLEFNDELLRSDDSLMRSIEMKFNSLLRRVGGQAVIGEGGTVSKKKSDLVWQVEDFEAVVCSRRSIRNFTDQVVDESLIRRAVCIAQNSPSACNRQPSRVYAFGQTEDKQKLLELQNGNRGFGHLASHVLVVTSDLQCFSPGSQRNQCWIDGGLFCMTLVYSLHSLGLGTCMLNWCAKVSQDKKIHRIFSIPTSEVVVMLIAVGHLPHEYKVANSARRPTEAIFKIN